MIMSTWTLGLFYQFYDIFQAKQELIDGVKLDAVFTDHDHNHCPTVWVCCCSGLQCRIIKISTGNSALLSFTCKKKITGFNNECSRHRAGHYYTQTCRYSDMTQMTFAKQLPWSLLVTCLCTFALQCSVSESCMCLLMCLLLAIKSCSRQPDWEAWDIPNNISRRSERLGYHLLAGYKGTCYLE